jgi:hypothetical protein
MDHNPVRSGQHRHHHRSHEQHRPRRKGSQRPVHRVPRKFTSNATAPEANAPATRSIHPGHRMFHAALELGKVGAHLRESLLVDGKTFSVGVDAVGDEPHALGDLPEGFELFVDPGELDLEGIGRHMSPAYARTTRIAKLVEQMKEEQITKLPKGDGMPGCWLVRRPGAAVRSGGSQPRER